MKRAVETIKKILHFYFFDALFHFSGTNTPSYKTISIKLDYEKYWKFRDITKINLKLRRREFIAARWIKEGSRVMDFGCGVSGLLMHLKSQKNCNVLGADISKRALRVQTKSGIPTLHIRDKNYLERGKFDYIVLTEVIEHMANPEELIDDLRKITDNLIISVPNSAYMAYRFKLLLRGRISMQWMYHPAEHLRYWSHVEFIEWMEALGYSLKEFKSLDGIFTSKGLWPNLFSWNILYLFIPNISLRQKKTPRK